MNTADYKKIEGFTASNKNDLQSSSFPPALGYSQELLKENYRLTIVEIDADGNKAWISLSKNGGEVDSSVVSVGESYNYNSLLSFKLDKVFGGTSRNYIKITNIYQYSEIDSSVIVQNESALLHIGSTGKLILTGGGLKWQLEENYILHAIDIDDLSREALLLITKDGTHIDYTIINVSDSYTYYKNEKPIITADIETIFIGEGGVYLARLYHVYQYSENTGETLLSDAIHLYSVGNTREVEWQLNQNYSLSTMDIDSKDTQRQVWLRLKKNGNTLEDKFSHSGDSAIFYDSGTKILDLKVGTIFDGKEADLVFISDVYQYSETNENDILIENEPHLFIFGNTTGNDWQLYENYTVSFMDIDIKKDPNRVWLRMKKNGVPVDDNVVAQNEEYRFYNNSALLFEGHLNSSFGGRYLDMLTLTNANQYSELDSTSLIVDTTYSFYPENVELIMDSNEKLSLDENYTIVPVDIQGFYYLDRGYYHTNQSLWLRLFKNDVMVDEVILLEGQDYSYYDGSIKIISTKIATIFMGVNTDIIKFEDFYQYSEVDGSLIKYYGDILLRFGRFIPPTLTITSPINGTTVSTSTITVSGTATDDTGVTNLTVNGNPVTVETDGSFTNTVSLTSGVNTITVIATDVSGISTTETVTVTYFTTPLLVSAITPNSRLAQVGTPVTIFMSVINAGTGSATDVSISQASSLPATVSYQAWNVVILTGTPDTPMDIGSGETVNYVLTIDPTSEFVSSAMTFNVSGTNSGSAPISGVNTLTMAASTTPYADVIMMSTSLDVSTAVNTPTAFALATTNVGSANATDVSLVVDIPSSITGLVYQVNETNPDGSIKGPATGLTIPVGGQPTFAVFLVPTQAIDYDPVNNRLMLKLVDGSGKVIGAQSVAVSTV